MATGRLAIREMLPGDIPAIVRIERVSFSTPWSETSFYTEIYHRHALTWVVETDGSVTGYICIRRIVDECHLMNLAVHPLHRACGIAARLLEEMIAELTSAGDRSLYLEVRVSNRSARMLYERSGFRTVGIRKNYYAAPPEDAVIMMLDLRRMPAD
jgi:ribosomal-protein-alanine N-acetyltransferase